MSLAILLHPELRTRGSVVEPSSASSRSHDSKISEANSLMTAAGLDLAAERRLTVSKPRAATLIGQGQIADLKDLINQSDATVVMINHALTPLQQRNLERDLEVKVIDRVGLIIEIFGQRAATKEGRLQVDLAALTYQRSRLVRAWTNLDRQRGGRGFTGGPGEKRLELDRREIDQQIVKLKSELEQVRKTRALHRKSREKAPYPIVVLVGYTNAGKSTLFNAMTDEQVMAKDMLFATLDPKHARLELPDNKVCLASDTVGFIGDLPTELIEAFRATLEEVEQADIILHVRDLSNPDTAEQKAEVLTILDEILGAEALEQRLVEVGNKADLMAPGIADTYSGQLVSAVSGRGLEDLKQIIASKLAQADHRLRLAFPSSNGALYALVFSLATVEQQSCDENGIHELVIKASSKSLGLIKQAAHQQPDVYFALLD